MEKRVELEKRGRKPSKITELILDNCKSTTVSGLSEEWESLESLSMINVGLTSLKGFPKLVNLKKLDISDNRISSGLEYLTCLVNLTHLNLSGNKLSHMASLEPLKELKNLVNLDLYTCDVCQEDDYRERVFGMISSLVYLDGFDKEDKSEDEEDDRDEANGEEVDGEEDDEDDEVDEDLDEEEVEEEEEEVPLEDIYKDYNADEDDKDYEALDDGSDDEIEEEEENGEAEEGASRGQKRKHQEEEA